MKELSLKEIQNMQLQLAKIVDKVCRKHKIKYYLISGSCLGMARHGGFIPWDDDIDLAMMRSDYNKFIEVFDMEFDTDKYKLVNEDIEKEFTGSLSRIIFRGTELSHPTLQHINVDHGMFMDIFPLDNVPDEPMERRDQKNKLERVNRILFWKIWQKSVGDKASIKNAIKRLRSIILLPLPLRYLKKVRKNIIQKYDTAQTSCVCSMASKYGYTRHIMSREIYGEPLYLPFENELLPFPEKYQKHLIALFGKDYMQLPSMEKREKPTPVYLL